VAWAADASVNGKNFKVHLDGYNLLPFLKGEARNRRAKDSLLE
jgi:hypothetical protein